VEWEEGEEEELLGAEEAVVAEEGVRRIASRLLKISWKGSLDI
jgi:hypothetical protein